MASTSSIHEEEFLCSICLDVFTDPITTPCGHNYCKACITKYWEGTDVCQCPLCKEKFCKRPKLSVNKVVSEMADQFRKSKQLKQTSSTNQEPAKPHEVSCEEECEGKKAELGKTEAEVQQMIQERQVKVQGVKHSVDLSKKHADREIADSVQVFTAMISCIERSQAELIDVIEKKQKTTEKQAEGFIKDLEQEITELKKRSSELKHLSHTEDHLHLLQNFTSINTPPPTKDWTKVNVHQPSYVETVWTAVAQLEKTLSQEMKKLCDELKRIQQYAVDVTLDPDTAHPNLILSEDGKQVHDGNIKKDLPDNTTRLTLWLSVLGKQSFSSGRFYYEVQVKDKTEWHLGVVRESINRKGAIKWSPDNGYCIIRTLKGYEYHAHSDPDVSIPVKEKLQKVGVFVDYEEGLVSFYDVETRVHLYSFTGCTFTEKIYPFFNTGEHDNGKNSAPLIISPVNHID